MKCSNCGNTNAVGSAFCMECGTPLSAETATAERTQLPTQASAEVLPGQAPPPIPYDPPYPPQALQPPRVPTIRNVHLGDVLFLISSALLLVAGFENFASLSRFVLVQYVLLGFFAIVGGLLFLGGVVMPYVLRPIEKYMDMIVLTLSAIYLFWGVAAMFGTNIGFNGGMVFIGGLFGLSAMALKMGILR